MMAVFHRELRSLWQSMTGWLVMALVPLAFAVATVLNWYNGVIADYIRVIVDSTLVFGAIVLVYAVQGYAKDERSGANRLLHVLPLRSWQLALGRYFAYCVPFIAGVIVSCAYPIALSFCVEIVPAQVIWGMLAFTLCGMSMIALALYLSCIHKNGLVNVLFALIVLAVCYFLPNFVQFLVSSGAVLWSALACIAGIAIVLGWKTFRSFSGALVCGVLAEAIGIFCMGKNADAGVSFWKSVCNMVNIQTRFANTYLGIFDIGDLVFFILVSVLFIALSAAEWQMKPMQKRRVK